MHVYKSVYSAVKKNTQSISTKFVTNASTRLYNIMLSDISKQWSGGLERQQAKHDRTGAMSLTTTCVYYVNIPLTKSVRKIVPVPGTVYFIKKIARPFSLLCASRLFIDVCGELTDRIRERKHTHTVVLIKGSGLGRDSNLSHDTNPVSTL